MNDINGRLITPGSKFKRVVDGRVTHIGHEYTAILSKFSSDEQELVADGGFVKELLTPERAKEFEVIE